MYMIAVCELELIFYQCFPKAECAHALKGLALPPPSHSGSPSQAQVTCVPRLAPSHRHTIALAVPNIPHVNKTQDDTVSFLRRLTCACVRLKARLAAASVLFAHAFVRCHTEKTNRTGGRVTAIVCEYDAPAPYRRVHKFSPYGSVCCACARRTGAATRVE